MATEDKRQAASLAVGVSNQLITAALTMLPILGAILVFVLDKRSITWVGGTTVVVSFLLFLISITAGVTGISAIYNKGYTGEWHYMNGDGPFQIQAISALLGLIIFTLSIFLMGPPQQDVELIKIKNSVINMHNNAQKLNHHIIRLQRAVDSLKAKSPLNESQMQIRKKIFRRVACRSR